MLPRDLGQAVAFLHGVGRATVDRSGRGSGVGSDARSRGSGRRGRIGRRREIIGRIDHRSMMDRSADGVCARQVGVAAAAVDSGLAAGAGATGVSIALEASNARGGVAVSAGEPGAGAVLSVALVVSPVGRSPAIEPSDRILASLWFLSRTMSPSFVHGLEGVVQDHAANADDVQCQYGDEDRHQLESRRSVAVLCFLSLFSISLSFFLWWFLLVTKSVWRPAP